VAELLRIVEGASKGLRSSHVSAEEPPRTMGERFSSPASGRLAVSGGRAVGPETLLPLHREEDEGF
jgi:hypothetical protein